MASHDLQEPLRKIQAFGDRLRGKFRSQLPEGGRDYVDRMLTSAGRMRRLIDDLLTFSRVTTQGRPFERIDLDAVLRDVKSDLEVRIEQTRGTVDVGPLPAIDADFSQMRQLFQNLLGNALKFHRPGVPPVVRVRGELLPPLPSGERGGGEGAPSPSPGSPRESPSPPRGEGQAGDPVPLTCRVIVQDNGIGFDETRASRRVGTA